MFKKILYFIFCSVIIVSSVSARIYSRKKAMETLSRGLIVHLDMELENAAVLDFINLDGRVSMLGKHIAEEMSTRLSKWGNFTIIERALINKVIAEQEYALSDFVAPDKAAEFGKLVGAKGIVIGTITELDKSFQVNARIIHTETGEVLSTSQVEIRKDADTVKLASQIIVTPKREEKKAEVVKEPEPKPAPKPKAEKPIVKEEPKEKIFYFEDFSGVEEGEIPNGWLGGEKLMVKKGYRREKFLTDFEKKEKHEFTIENIKFPENFEFEYWFQFGDDHHFTRLFCYLGKVSTMIDVAGYYYLGESRGGKEEANKHRNKIVKAVIQKKGAVFRFFINGEEVVMARYPEFKTPKTVTFKTKNMSNFKFLRIVGRELD